VDLIVHAVVKKAKNVLVQMKNVIADVVMIANVMKIALVVVMMIIKNVIAIKIKGKIYVRQDFYPVFLCYN
jgi:hypothetical protein